MDEFISNLKTPKECFLIIEKYTKLINEARLRLIDLLTASQNPKDKVESQLWEALFAYEAILSEKNHRRTIAGRTRPLIKIYGIKEAAEKIVSRKIDAMGYRILVDKGLKEMTFEAVIVRNPDDFHHNTVKLCRERLEELEKILKN